MRLRRLRRSAGHLVESITGPLLLGGAALVAFDVARRVFRHTQLFCPTREPVLSWDPEDYGLKRNRVDDCWFESDDGSILNGWYCHADNPIASALYFHGNTGNLTTIAAIIPHILVSGINVLIFDYRGFGRSSGIPSLHGVVADGLAAARFHDSLRPKDLPSILYGYSLGGAIAAQVIRHHPFDGLVLQSTFTNLPDITRASFPKVPLHLFSGTFFDTLSVVKKVKVPLLVVHGGADEVCPRWMADKMHDACCGPKRLLIVDGGLHKDLFERDPDSVIRAINQWALDLPRNASAEVEPTPALDRAIDAAFRTVRRYWRRAEAPQSL